MKSLAHFEEIILCSSPVDFRKGMQSLSALVEAELEINPFTGALVLFTNKHKDAIKILYWDKTGFALWHKILDKEKFKWPKKVESKTLGITVRELEWLLEGIDYTKIKTHTSLEYNNIS